jgi:hypothetical protein
MPNRQHSKSIFVVTLTSIVVNLPVNWRQLTFIFLQIIFLFFFIIFFVANL